MESIFDKLIKSLLQAADHNSNVMVKPEVILWPDPERQWAPVISKIQEKLSSLWIYGPYEPESRQGPAIWIKCMVKKSSEERKGKDEVTPIIYLPGISKYDFKNIGTASLQLQPLMEYQYTGTMWLHENGKEWTVAAFVQNAQHGLGVKMAQDTATKDALLSALSDIFQDQGVFYNKSFIDADFLLSTIYPDIIPNIIKWMIEGDGFLNSLTDEKRKTFGNLCKTRYEFEPDYRNIKDVVLKFGSQKNAWSQVWQYFANAPAKYTKMTDLLRMAKPDDLGFGIFALPEDSWPQVNEEKEDKLRDSLQRIEKVKINEVVKYLEQIANDNKHRKITVWYEIGRAPLVDALDYLFEMASCCSKPYSHSNLNELVSFYIEDGYKADQAMRKAFASVVSQKDIDAVKSVIIYVYKPWLENLNQKFQKLLEEDASVFVNLIPEDESESFVLFVDALRYELAVEYSSKLNAAGFVTDLNYKWTALPTLTPTSKPFNSPVATLVSKSSECNEFRPQLNTGKDLLTSNFREALQQKDFHFAANSQEINSSTNNWMEIGDIDTKGHQEQSSMLKGLDEMYRQFLETIEAAFEKGFKRIKVVTDHGWLMLPGGLPKTQLSKHLTETRWGRCALIKEEATTDLINLPWYWNPNVFIAYAPGISFFKNNVEYAHGGISIQECLVPTMLIQSSEKTSISGKVKSVVWNNLICKIETDETEDGYLIDIRTKANDESTSIILSAREKRIVTNNKCSLMVDDSYEGMAVWVVLTTSEGIIVDKKTTSVGN